MNPLSGRRLQRTVRAIAALVAMGTTIGVVIAIVHDGEVVEADLYCRGKAWSDRSARQREEKREAIAGACTPGMISALSSRPARSPEEKACESLYYPPATEAVDAAIMSSCHLATRPASRSGGVMLSSTRAWRACAAATPGLDLCARDAWLLVLGVMPLILVLVSGIGRRG